MKKNEFVELWKKNIVVLDGATGTELQKYGMPNDVCPEKWILENPEFITEIQQNYVEAGSDIVYAPTFGGNRIKLAEFGLSEKINEINSKLLNISKKAVGNNAFVAGDIAPTGKFVEPFGDLLFTEAVKIYKEQIKILSDNGADILVIETMMDLQETRAALIAAKESCDLPVMVSMTFSEEGRTLTGTDPISALITLQSLGADAVGLNCSTGPESMLKIIQKIKPFATIPLLAKPNAGLPQIIDNKTVFSMSAKKFAEFVPIFIESGVNIFGGCCGTSPEYIKYIKDISKISKPILPVIDSISALSSARQTIFLGYDQPFRIIGERINPTGKKLLQEELKNNKLNIVRKFALEQIENGAEILDVNVGMPNINEKDKMLEVIKLLSTIVNTPLCIDSSDIDVIEAALKIYPGRALINSISAEKIKLEKLLPIAAKYGAMFIVLPLNDSTVPKTSEKRIDLINQIIKESKNYGFTNKDIIVDGLVMTVSSNDDSAVETLKVMEYCKNILKCNTTAGLSNISFGLPERTFINATFLAMCAASGMTTAISNPSLDLISKTKYAIDVLLMKDKNCKTYISKFTNLDTKNNDIDENKSEISIEKQIFNTVVEGDSDNIEELVKIAVNEKKLAPSKIVNENLIPAINVVGKFYDEKKYFLPQLIAGAETMKKAFNFLEPLLKSSEKSATKKNLTIIMATVKGDIHDIGKNIVCLMLKNYGFNVIDMGKDVPAQKIIETAVKNKADFIGLSALMTTTMPQMKIVVDLIKEKNLNFKVLVGGAVVTEKFAKEIGAYAYGGEAINTVRILQNYLKEN